MLINECVICEEQREDGIYLYTTFICTSCEYNLIHTEPREKKYNYYVNKLKQLDEPTTSI